MHFRSDYRNFMYNEERSVVFAYVPKVACTNWKSIFRNMAGQENWLDSALAHDRVNGGLRYLDLRTSDTEILMNPVVKKLAMVRSPYSRVLSAYLNKIEPRIAPTENRQPDHFTSIVESIEIYRGENLDGEQFPRITFEVFLLWLDNEKGLKDGNLHFRNDEHWAKQVDLLQVDSVQYNFVGRFENIKKDAIKILQMIGTDIAFPSQTAVRFQPTGASKKIAEYYTKTTRELVEKIFVTDFSTFSYSHQH